MKRYQETRHALGSAAFITLVMPDNDASSDHLFAELWQQIDAFEQRFSRFLSDSELTVFNHAAGTEQTVSSAFYALLKEAKRMSKETAGLYNPLILPALQQAGYKGSWPEPSAVVKSLDYSKRKTASWDTISLGDGWAKIPQDTAVDFGGIGKGYLLDQLGTWLNGQSIPGYCLSLGGDIVCAGTDLDGNPWSVAVQSALYEGSVAATIQIGPMPMALATSGITKRKGLSDGRTWHHIIDPRSGKPATTNIATATICAPRATDADVLAKCIVIVGDKDVPQFLQEHHIEQALWQIQDEDGHIQKKEVGTTWLT